MKFSGNITEKMMRSVGKSKNRAKSCKGHWSYELTAVIPCTGACRICLVHDYTPSMSLSFILFNLFSN